MKITKGILSRVVSLILIATMLLGFCTVANASEPVYADLVDFLVDVEVGREPRILQITDTQIIESEQRRSDGRLSSGDQIRWSKTRKDQNCYDYVEQVVEEFDPDLIILTGDIVYGEFDDSGRALLDLIEFFDSLETPWAPVYGNHDNESKKGVDWQCAQLEASEYCLFEQGNLTGNGNYTVGITQGGELKRVFFMMDSNGCAAASEKSKQNSHMKTSAGFGTDQIAWYKEVMKDIKEVSPNTKLSAAFHIQLSAMGDAIAQYGSYPIVLDAVGKKGDQGYIGTVMKGAWDSDKTVYNSMKELGVDSIFNGHEHLNNGNIFYDGIHFVYGLKSSTYDRYNSITAAGAVAAKGVKPYVGGTAITLLEDGSIGEIRNIVAETEASAEADGYDKVSASGTSVFGTTSFWWNHVAQGTSEAAADGVYTKFNGGQATITAKKTFYVEETKEYILEVYAATSLTHNALSEMNFKIDSGDEITMTKDNSTVRTLENPCRTDDPWTTKGIKYNTGILLEKGVHTLTFTVPQASNNRTDASFVFDCATFTVANTSLVVKSDEATTFGNSAFTWSDTNDKKTSDAATDGTYSSCDWGGSVRTAEATFQVEKTGTYALSINAVTDLTLEGASAINFSIDDGDVITMKTTDSTVTALATPWKTSNNWTVKNVAYNGDFVLEAGTHTLKFELQFSTVSSKVIYAFDCATLTPTNNLLAVKADAATTIGNQSFLRNETNDKKDNVNAYDGTYSSCDWGGAVRTFKKTFYVEKTGTYSFSINAVTDLTLDGASPVNFSVDGGGKIPLTASNATVTALANPWKTTNNWTVKNIAYNGDFVLEEGLHTLEFEIPKRSAGDVVIYAFDCATIIPTNNLLTLSADTATTIGNLSFERSSANDKKENASAHDGTYSSSNWGGSIRTFKKTFYVAKKGTYKLDINAVIDLVLGGTAPMSFTIDGGNKVNLTSSNATVTALANPWQTNTDKWTVKNIAYNGEFVLEEGLHTLEFELQFNSANNRVIYAFDCATLTPTSKAIIVKGDEATTIGNASLTWSEANDKKDNTSAYDGTYSSSNWGGSVRTATMMIEVEETGTYALDINAVTDLTLGGAAPMSFSVDGGQKIKLTSSNSTVTALANPWKTSDNWTVKNIAYNQDLLLEKGSHTITFEFQFSSVNNKVIYAFDCVTLMPFVPTVLPKDGGVVEIENSVSKAGQKTHDAASGGAYIKCEGSDNQTVVVEIMAEAEGYYRLTLDATSAKLSAQMSYMALNVNGSKPHYLMSNTDNYTAEIKTDASGTMYPDDEYAISEITLHDAVYLQEGLNTIAIYVGVREGTNKAYGVLDCLRLSPAVTVTLGDTTLAMGDEIEGLDLSELDVYGAVYGENNKLLSVDIGEFVDGSAELDVGSVNGKTVIYVWDKANLKPYVMRTIK